MSETDQSVESILKKAIMMEIQGKEFFERAADRMSNSRARDMFTGLSKQEQRHIDVLTHQLTRLGNGQELSGLKEAMDDPSTAGSHPVFPDADIKRLGLREEAGELEVIQFGMEVERKSMDYYEDARRNTTSKSAEDMFAWLVAEETSHLAILKAEHDNRSGSGFYYDEAQFSLETQ